MGTIKTTTLLYIELFSLIVLCVIPAMFINRVEIWLISDLHYRAGYYAAMSDSAKIE